MKVKILYYSRSGNTENLAEKIAEELSCEMLKVEPKESYGNYIMSCLRIMKEKFEETPPAFATPVPDLSDVDIVIAGFPVWSQDIPRFFVNFLSSCDLAGKIVIPFCTYEINKLDLIKPNGPLSTACSSAELKLPLNYCIFRNNDYDGWIEQVKALCS